MLVATLGLSPHASATKTIPVYIFAGQSNMVGMYTSAGELPVVDHTLSAPQQNVLFWGPTSDSPDRWGPLSAPTEVREPVAHSGFGPEISAGAALSQRHPGTQIGVIKYAKGGTNLYTEWSPSTPFGLYQALLTRTRLALSYLWLNQGVRGEIKGVFWMQGESDSYTMQTAKTYGANLKRFIRALRRDLNAPKMAFVIGRIPDLRKVDSRLPYTDVVRQQQMMVARTFSRTYIVSTDGLERSPLSAIHFSSRGTVDLGRHYVRRSFPL